MNCRTAAKHHELTSGPLAEASVLTTEVVQYDHQIINGCTQDGTEASMVDSVFMGNKVTNLYLAIVLQDKFRVANSYNRFVSQHRDPGAVGKDQSPPVDARHSCRLKRVRALTLRETRQSLGWQVLLHSSHCEGQCDSPCEHLVIGPMSGELGHPEEL